MVYVDYNVPLFSVKHATLYSLTIPLILTYTISVKFTRQPTFISVGNDHVISFHITVLYDHMGKCTTSD